MGVVFVPHSHSMGKFANIRVLRMTRSTRNRDSAEVSIEVAQPY